MPMTPIPHTLPRMYDSISRLITVAPIETIVVNLTSPAARSPLLIAPEKGYTTALNRLWMNTSWITSVFVSASSA